MAEDGSEYWQSVIEKLEGDRATVAVREAAAAEEARPLALPAATGDAKAAKRLAEINARRDALVREAETFSVALTTAREQHAAAVAKERAAQDAERRAVLAEEAKSLIQRAQEFDAAARALAVAAAGYDQELTSLSRRGLTSTQYNRLRNRTMTAGALHIAGLTGHVPLPAVSPGHRKTLEAWAKQMLGAVTEPPAEAA